MSVIFEKAEDKIIIRRNENDRIQIVFNGRVLSAQGLRYATNGVVHYKMVNELEYYFIGSRPQFYYAYRQDGYDNMPENLYCELMIKLTLWQNKVKLY